jgi:hypothetical protein
VLVAAVIVFVIVIVDAIDPVFVIADEIDPVIVHVHGNAPVWPWSIP